MTGLKVWTRGATDMYDRHVFLSHVDGVVEVEVEGMRDEGFMYLALAPGQARDLARTLEQMADIAREENG